MSPHKTPLTDRVVDIVVLVAGAGMVILGLWAYVSPGSFADFADFPEHTHFVHDLAAFQLGIGVTLLLATIWSDALAIVLTGFLLANTAHVANHVADLDHGGRAWQAWGLALLSVAVAVALGLRLRALEYVVGRVGTATTPALLPYLRQRTMLLTSRATDAGGEAVTIAVDGDRAYVGRLETSDRADPLGDHPDVRLAPASPRGQPTGPGFPATIRRLEGSEAQRAAWSLRRQYPLLHGVLLPLAPRFGPSEGDRMAYFALTPTDGGNDDA
jgi:hypothetical protein